MKTLIERGGPAAIIFEVLAERTLAFAQLERRSDPAKGYEPAIELQVRPILRDCIEHGIPIVSNFGAANPRGGADWDALGGATMACHLLECGTQVTGGYFADPGMKGVPGLANVGYPIGEIARERSRVISKAAATGAIVDARTVQEQPLWELHDPEAYLTPDVVANISAAEVAELGNDRRRPTGVRGHARPPTLKANVLPGEVGSARARSPMRDAMPRRAHVSRWKSSASGSGPCSACASTSSAS